MEGKAARIGVESGERKHPIFEDTMGCVSLRVQVLRERPCLFSFWVWKLKLWMWCSSCNFYVTFSFVVYTIRHIRQVKGGGLIVGPKPFFFIWSTTGYHAQTDPVKYYILINSLLKTQQYLTQQVLSYVVGLLFGRPTKSAWSTL